MGILNMGVAYLAFSAIHAIQFILAITVCGLYGVDLRAATRAGAYADSKWVYAEIVGGLSAVSALVLLVPLIQRANFVWAWNFVLFVLWIALFGVFGKMYIHEDPEGSSGIRRMKSAVWVDLTNALLWLITFVAGLLYWVKNRDRVTRFTGRARV